jgi:hypothetical protein
LKRHSAKLNASLNLEQGKLTFSNGEFDRALQALRRANGYFQSWKLRAVLLLLRVWPSLLLRIYQRRERQAFAGPLASKG